MAPLQASLAGAAPPLHEGQAEPGQGTQLSDATNPEPRIEKSETNSKVRQPVVEVSIAGSAVPVKDPSTGAAVVEPL